MAGKSIVNSIGLVFLGAVSSFGGETIVARSGNPLTGDPSHDASIRFISAPASGNFSHVFTPPDFIDAELSQSAYILTPNASWIVSLPSDPSAKWIGASNISTANCCTAKTALYSISFRVTHTFQAATMSLAYAVDDAIGETAGGSAEVNSGVYINGTPVCGTSFPAGAAQVHQVNCGNISSLLQVGTNWLYIENLNSSGPAGLLFSATITTIDSPAINQGGVVNNAPSAVGSAVAPGSIASIYGTFPIAGPAQAAGTPWPATLGNLSTQFSGIVAPLVYASPLLANVQVPWELSGQAQALATVSVGNQVSSPQTVHLAAYAPGIFVVNSQGQGAILDSAYRLADSSNPASAGLTYIQVFCTGLGPVTNQPDTGAAAPSDPLAATTTMPTLTIGGVPATVVFAGLTPTAVGLYQVNAQIPAAVKPGNAVPVLLTIGGVASNTVTMAIAPNPVPAITNLSPASVPSGSSPFVLTINGSGFTSSSTVTYAGHSHPVTFVSSSQLKITVTAVDLSLATVGTFSVIVTNPPPGGGTSAVALFTVTAPGPGVIAGHWSGSWYSDLIANAGGVLSANLTQIGSSISGTINLAASPCFGTGNVAGQPNGASYILTATFVDSQVAVISASVSGNTITGSYSVRSGACTGDVGRFNATRN